jgi:hypothetical protein
MPNSNPRMQIVCSIIGLVCVILSIVLNFALPQTFWNWGLLLVAAGFLWLSRRYRQ